MSLFLLEEEGDGEEEEGVGEGINFILEFKFFYSFINFILCYFLY